MNAVQDEFQKIAEKRDVGLRMELQNNDKPVVSHPVLMAALEQHGAGGRELSETTLALAQYATGAPDLEAGQEVSDLWRVLRGAIRAHDARAGSR